MWAALGGCRQPVGRRRQSAVISLSIHEMIGHSLLILIVLTVVASADSSIGRDPTLRAAWLASTSSLLSLPLLSLLLLLLPSSLPPLPLLSVLSPKK